MEYFCHFRGFGGIFVIWGVFSHFGGFNSILVFFIGFRTILELSNLGK